MKPVGRCATREKTWFGFGKGGTGVLSVDGKELARQTIPHTIPILMAIDETFDVGIDTRTPVDDSYKLPFRFTGKIDKLTFELGRVQVAEEEQRKRREAVARARDSDAGTLRVWRFP